VSLPYTTRFIVSNRVATRCIYEVPENKRAIVQTVVFCNAGTEANWAAFTLHGYQLFFPAVPAKDSMAYTELRLVLYERETMEIYLTASGLSACVSGYLFDDNGPGNPPPVVEIPTRRPGLLPSAAEVLE
jgi:hypothetical protein